MTIVGDYSGLPAPIQKAVPDAFLEEFGDAVRGGKISNVIRRNFCRITGNGDPVTFWIEDRRGFSMAKSVGISGFFTTVVLALIVVTFSPSPSPPLLSLYGTVFFACILLASAVIWVVSSDHDKIRGVAANFEELYRSLVEKEIVRKHISWICWASTAFKNEEELKRDADKILIHYASLILDQQNHGEQMSANEVLFREFKEVYDALGAFALADFGGYDRYFKEAKGTT